jgi:hypothetical protein
MPELNLSYPPAAWQSSIMGFVKVTFTVGSDGTATQFESKSHPLLAAGVASALHSARFRPQCSGKRITISVGFSLVGDAPVGVNKLSPTEYLVVAEPKTIHVESYDPAGMFTTRRGRFAHRAHVLLSKLRPW